MIRMPTAVSRRVFVCTALPIWRNKPVSARKIDKKMDLMERHSKRFLNAQEYIVSTQREGN